MTTNLGRKAEGLAALPASWTPTYIPLDEQFVAKLYEGPPTTAAQIARRLRESPRGTALRELFSNAPAGVIVRSSATVEGIGARGLYQSVGVDFPSFTTVAECAMTIWDHACEVGGTERPIPVLVQEKVHSLLIGHLSNERRLREDRRDWAVEAQGPLSEARGFGMRALREDRVPLESISPRCGTADELRHVLRRVAGAFTRPGTRFHLEWVWDGERVWLVQRDAVEEFSSPRPTARGTAQHFPPLSAFRRARQTDADIPKLRCVAEYVRLGLPHADLVILRDPVALEAIVNDMPPQGVLDDLAQLAAVGAVIRTDYVRQAEDFEVLLPRTDIAQSPAQMLDFIRTTARQLVRDGVTLADVVFMSHPFIPAEGAAWSLAAPQTNQVRIDATFGLADGLLYYPHDSYEVDSRTGQSRARLRCKSPILLCDADGTWRDHPLGSPWDWRPALSEEERTTIADMSKLLADDLRRPVETMFFVRPSRGGEETLILPWVHRADEVRSLEAPATDSHFPKRAVVVRDAGDLRVLHEALNEAATHGARFLVRLQPAAGVLHDARFLQDVIRLCRPERCAVELAGSTLSHAFYELARGGVQVKVVDPIELSESEPIEFDKLVRDHIPRNIAARGERVRTYRAAGRELEGLLRDKVIEEAFEVATSATTSDLMSEIGDVLDVLNALCALAGTTLDTVAAWSAKKRRERGGFQDGIVLVETREPSLHEAVADEPGTYPVTAAIGEEVQRRRRASPRRDSMELDEEIRIPYRVASSETSDDFRVVIAGDEYLLRFDPGGLVVRRRHPGPDPDQLALGI